LKNPEEFIQSKIAEIKSQVSGKNCIIAVSGGVDSTTAAALCSRAIEDKLTAIHVDTGLMRKNESEEVISLLKKLGVSAKLVNAQERFYTALEGIADPEQKRKVIGELFIKIFEEEAGKLPNVEFLVQGTIAPDWIESGTGAGNLTDTIKSHHNVGGLPEQMNLKLVEPMRDLYKDEVREVAKALEIPKELYAKQPFPGPGLAVRILSDVTAERARILQEADFIFCGEIKKAVEAGKMTEPWQYFAVLLPVKTVGVQGDARVYGDTIGLRAVESSDGMTASFSRIPDDILLKISTKIMNSLKDSVNRIVYDITNKPPATIEWE